MTLLFPSGLRVLLEGLKMVVLIIAEHHTLSKWRDNQILVRPVDPTSTGRRNGWDGQSLNRWGRVATWCLARRPVVRTPARLKHGTSSHGMASCIAWFGSNAISTPPSSCRGLSCANRNAPARPVKRLEWRERCILYHAVSLPVPGLVPKMMGPMKVNEPRMVACSLWNFGRPSG